MIFAEETSLGQWGTFITLVIGAIGLQINAWRKHKYDQANESDKKQIQIEQRDVLRQLEVGQAKQNGKLSEVVSINLAHHEELIRSLQTNCRAQPVLVQQLNQTPKEKS